MSTDIHPNSTKSYREQQVAGRTVSFRRRVFGIIEAIGPKTDRQVLEALGEHDVNNVRPEITRLVDDGLLVEVGSITCERTGKRVRLTQATGAPYRDRNRK